MDFCSCFWRHFSSRIWHTAVPPDSVFMDAWPILLSLCIPLQSLLPRVVMGLVLCLVMSLYQNTFSVDLSGTNISKLCFGLISTLVTISALRKLVTFMCTEISWCLWGSGQNCDDFLVYWTVWAGIWKRNGYQGVISYPMLVYLFDSSVEWERPLLNMASLRTCSCQWTCH